MPTALTEPGVPEPKPEAAAAVVAADAARKQEAEAPPGDRGDGEPERGDDGEEEGEIPPAGQPPADGGAQAARPGQPRHRRQTGRCETSNEGVFGDRILRTALSVGQVPSFVRLYSPCGPVILVQYRQTGRQLPSFAGRS
jgi:hypothetical protein